MLSMLIRVFRVLYDLGAIFAIFLSGKVIRSVFKEFTIFAERRSKKIVGQFLDDLIISILSNPFEMAFAECKIVFMRLEKMHWYVLLT